MNESETLHTELLNRLAATPMKIVRLVAGLTAQQLQTAPASGGWAPREILAHLRASDDILTSRIQMLLTRDNPPIYAFDERRWAELAGYASHNFHTSLTLFTLRRDEIIKILEQLPAEAWERIGTHELNGPFSLTSLLEKIARHEEEHCIQLEQFAATYL